MQPPEKSSPKELVVHPNGSLTAPARVLYIEPLNSDPSLGDNPTGLFEYWHLIRHRLVSICFITFFGLLAGILISLAQTPVYQARISLDNQNPSESALNVRIDDLETDGATLSQEAYLPTQVQILQRLTLRQLTLSRRAQEKAQEDSRFAPPPLSFLARLGLAPKLHMPDSGTPPPVEVKVRVEDNTRIVEILCDSVSARTAAAYANALANEYIDS